MKIKLNRAAFRELRNHPEAIRNIDARARRIAEEAGPGFAAASGPGKNRARASVATVNTKARQAAAADPGLLLRAMFRGGRDA